MICRAEEVIAGHRYFFDLRLQLFVYILTGSSNNYDGLVRCVIYKTRDRQRNYATKHARNILPDEVVMLSNAIISQSTVATIYTYLHL